jgi:periplasmic divalent cation tolerance protein
MTEYIVVLVTASHEEEAARIANGLVETGLAACVNIVKGIRSVYRWQGKIEDGNEALLVVKTRRDFFESIVKQVKELHSYTIPEIIALPVTEGSEEYLRWLEEETERGDKGKI